MIVRYTIDRKDLYNGDYNDSDIQLIDGEFTDKIKLRTHLSVIYRIIKKMRRRESK